MKGNLTRTFFFQLSFTTEHYSDTYCPNSGANLCKQIFKSLEKLLPFLRRVHSLTMLNEKSGAHNGRTKHNVDGKKISVKCIAGHGRTRINEEH